jgi:ectoine hydroxylase-related dioxygenase (phytanoyl-CoA dioxygenase family)
MCDLHNVGFKIFKKTIALSKHQITHFLKKSKQAKPIFNHNDVNDVNDGKRCQYIIKNPQKDKVIADIQKQLINLIKSNGVETALVPTEWTILKSLRGCQAQAAHCDYVPVDDFKFKNKLIIPLICLIAIEDDTKLNIWPYSQEYQLEIKNLWNEQIKGVELTLNEGDVLLARGDCVHAGAAYSKQNVRLHAYFDSNVFERQPDTTWLVENDMLYSKVIIPIA